MTTYTPTDFAYDYAIGGLPFLSAAGQKLTPYQNATLDRQTAPYRKEQFDNAQEPGDNSLQTWWTKSQMSFHGGAGQRFFDTSLEVDPFASVRFDTSWGVDVFTPGKARPCYRADIKVTTTTVSGLVPCADGSSFIWYSPSVGLKTRTTSAAASSGAADTTVTYGGVHPTALTALTSDGQHYYVSDVVGIWQGPLDNGAPGALLWNVGGATFSSVAFVKQRLMAAAGGSIFELAGAGGACPAAKYTHPNPNWTWSAWAEGPSCIYVAGYSGDQSGIFRFDLNSTGSVPTLTSAIETAPMPTGERVTGLHAYLGKYLAIGTNKGVRIGIIESDGRITYGPLTVAVGDPEAFLVGSLAAVTGFTGRDRFIYAGTQTVDGDLSGFARAGLVKIDLSQEVAPGRYAYAADIRSNGGGSPLYVTQVGDVLVFSGNAGIEIENKAALLSITTPTLTTSKIRFATLDPKVFKYLVTRLVGAATTTGTYLTSTGATGNITDLATGSTVSIAPAEWIQFTFAFTGGDASNYGASYFAGYQLKALPAQKRQRVERIPLLCYDLERDSTGGHRGELGTAYARLRALEALEEAGAIVTLQRFGPNFTSADDQQVVIDDIEFLQRDSPNKENGWGGVIHVTVRTVD